MIFIKIILYDMIKKLFVKRIVFVYFTQYNIFFENQITFYLLPIRFHILYPITTL